jgi:hypothetical protein
MSVKHQKIGAGHLKAMGRTGFKEIAQILPALPAHGVQPVEEPGLAGNLTPQEVARDKGAYEAILGKYASRGEHKQNEQQLTGGMER